MRTNMGTLTVPRTPIIVRIKPSEIKVPRRFPPPWSVEESGRVLHRETQLRSQALAYVYYEDEPGRAFRNYSRDVVNSCNAIHARRGDPSSVERSPP